MNGNKLSWGPLSTPEYGLFLARLTIDQRAIIRRIRKLVRIEVKVMSRVVCSADILQIQRPEGCNKHQ